MKTNFFDIKTIFIIALSLALVLTFIFHKSPKIDDNKAEITQLHNQNALLQKSNDSIIKVNLIIDGKLKYNDSLLAVKTKSLSLVQTNINTLKNEKNEIPNYVISLDANDVSNKITDYIQRHH